LYRGTEENNIEVVKILIAAGAHLNTSSKTEWWTPLYHAIRANSIEIVKILFEAGAGVNEADGLGLLLL